MTKTNSAPTIREACDEIAAELMRRGSRQITGEQIFNASPSGELWHVFELYWRLFPERLPADVENPEAGAMRYRDNAIQVWTGDSPTGTNGEWMSLYDDDRRG